MAFENRRRGGGIEKKEKREEIEKRNVARFFLLQSISSIEISRTLTKEEEKNIAENITFSRIIFIIKNQSSEQKGCIMPIGGKIEEGETPKAAAMREVIEETHTRPSKQSIQELDQKTTAQYEHRGKTREDHTQYFIGRLLPQDKPFPLRSSDHIASFLYLSPEELDTLLQKGEITQNEDTYPLIDTLQKNDENTDTTALHHEMLFHTLRIEGEKKLDVIEKLIQYRKNQLAEQKEIIKSDKNTFEELYDEIEKKRKSHLETLRSMSEKKDLTEMKKWYDDTLSSFWKIDVLKKLSFSLQDINNALHASNTDARLQYVQHQSIDTTTGVGIPTLALFLPLLEQRMREEKGENIYLSPAEEEILKTNPVAKKLLQMQESIDALISDTHLANPTDREIIQKLQSENIFLSENLTAENISRYSQIIDDYFNRLFSDAKIEANEPLRQQKSINTESLPNEQILYTLHQLATGSDQMMPQNPHMDNPLTQWQYEQQVRWEAARKRILILLLAHAEKIYTEKINQGIAAIDQQEEEILENISIEKIATRQKTLLSLFRKMIVRDSINEENTKDIFAGTFLCEGENDVTPKEYVVPEGIEITDAKNRKVTSITIPESLYHYITALAESQKEKNDGSTVRIIEWKEPKKGKMESSGAGGGGAIRMWKWYIERKEKDGTVQHKEIQAFAPTKRDDGSTKSAKEYFNEKKADDTRYGILRLFDSHTVRSFIELLFPEHIYAEEARAIYENVVSNKVYTESTQSK